MTNKEAATYLQWAIITLLGEKNQPESNLYIALNMGKHALEGIEDAIAEIERRIEVLENDLKDDRFYQGKLLGCKVCLNTIRKCIE